MEFLEAGEKSEEELVHDVFGLNDLQREIMDILDERELTVQEISSKTGRSRSTVQRALQELLDKDLVVREGKTDKTVYYVYTTLPREEIREITSQALEEWHEKVQEKLG